MQLGVNGKNMMNQRGPPLKYLQGSEIDKLELFSSSEDEKNNAKDIVINPIQRRRLLDSLNILTPARKREYLNDQ
jgi:hypothetical protein